MKRKNSSTKKVDFDNYSLNYRDVLKKSLGYFGKNDEFFDKLKLFYIEKWAIKYSEVKDILEFGCGIGKLASLLAKKFPHANVYGYDQSKKSLAVAKEENIRNKNISFGDELLEIKKFDLIVISNVFHHIPHKERVPTLTFLKELLKGKGKIIIFEHNPLNPLTCFIVKICPFDVDAELISRYKFIKTAKSCNLKVINKMYILFTPWSLTIFRCLERFLHQIPLGAQYMLLLEKKEEI